MPARRSLVLSLSVVLSLVATLVAIGVNPPGSGTPRATAQAPQLPTFGRATMSSIQGSGFEPGIRVDSAGRVYTHAPNSLSSGTSWIWISRDGGKTYKWVPAASPKEGKLPTCAGGGDSELGVDTANNIYFNELTLANFSVSRSEDQGRTFLPPGGSCFGVINTVVDRQWYATQGDPTAGGNIYLVHNKFAQDNPVCPGVIDPLNNLLVMARSPAGGQAGETAGIVFAPEKEISAPCNEGIMGNVEVSPTTGKIFVIHDNAAFNAILMGRCQNVPFTSDPTGLSCVDLPVASFPGFRTGGNFPTMAIDRAGNLMAVWEQAPVEADGDITGDTLLYWSSSTDEGTTWTPPVQIPTPGLRNNIFAWASAGDAGRVNVAWYGTPTPQNPADPTCGHTAARGGPDSAEGNWSLFMTQTLNGTDPTPTFTPPILVGEHHVSHSSAFTIIGGQCGDRTELGDFFQMRIGNQGEAIFAFTDSNNRAEISTHLMTVRQNGGSGVFASSPVINGDPAPTNAVADPAGDGTFEALGLTGPNQPNLDILSSRVSLLSNPARYRIRMVVADLTSLAPSPTSQNADRDLVWSTQWIKPMAPNPALPANQDQDGGKNFHVYMESLNGGPPTFWVGENAHTRQGGGVMMTYPGSTQVTGSYTPTAPGTITIDVPTSLVTVPRPIGGNRLFSVTASTMTLEAPANSVPVVGSLGGLKFNLIDVAPAYDFRQQSIRTSIP
jgi:hypothetical protein